MPRDTTAELVNTASAALQSEAWLWLEAFADCVRRRDFAAARALFAPGCHAFGTVLLHANELDSLEKKQWTKVWPRTSGFQFVRGGSRIVASADGTLVAALVRWKACNDPAPERMVYNRRGRATILLGRARVKKTAGPGGGWRAVHTHFSFDPPSKAASTAGRGVRDAGPV